MATGTKHPSQQHHAGSEWDKSSDNPIADISEKDVGELHSRCQGSRGKPMEMDSIMNDLRRIAQASKRLADATNEEAAELQNEGAVLSGAGQPAKGESQWELRPSAIKKS